MTERKMKDSGIEWIGDIPEEWKILRIKDAFKFTTGFTPDTQIATNYTDDYKSGFEWVTIADINNGQINSLTKSFISKDFINHKKFKPCPIGCLLYSFKLSVGQTAITNRNVFTNEAIACFYPNNKASINYLKYSSILIEYNSNTNIYGAKILNQQLINNALVTFPPLSEQQRIADFLDEKSSEIDVLTADIEEQIKILEEYKKSVITEAVTKGLNPNVEMKDSGIEWIGDIPKEWEVHPIYKYFDERKNTNYSLKEQNLLSLSYGKIIRKDINTNGGLLPASFNTYNIVERNDIIIRPTDLQNDKKSLRTGLVKEKGIITSAYIDLKPKSFIYPNYFHYLLHFYDITKVFYNMGNGVRQGLNYTEFSKLMVICPSLPEQQQIVEYLDHKCSEIDSIILSKKQQLETLVEYKKSLIYEYVTGKKEVA